MLRIILFPFEFTGDVFVLLIKLIRFLVGNFILSVWGLIVPVALLIALVMALFVAQNRRDLAAEYSSQLMNCEDRDVEMLVEALRKLDLAGLAEIVSCLRSEREKVFFVCYDVVQSELDNLPNLTDEKKRDKRYLTITDAILEQSSQLKPVAQNAVHQLVKQILRDLVNMNTNGRSRDLQLATMNCERILENIGTSLSQGKNKNGELQKPLTDSVVRYRAGNFHDELLTADGKPFRKIIKNDIADNQEYIANNKPTNIDGTTALALNNNENNKPNQFKHEYNTPRNLIPNQNIIVAQKDRLLVLPDFGEAGGKIASKFDADKFNADKFGKNITGNNSDNINERIDDNYNSSNANVFLTDELRNVRVNRIPMLSTVQLMKLLQHNNSECVSEARRTLIARDGFRDVHLQLAYQLYHPNPSVRKEVILHLSSTQGILSNAWLVELLNDPDDEVRYNAAALLATSPDPNIRRQLIEKCQHDQNEKLINLANKLRQR
ncbi:MAG: HEAT repeat domain-containing protein [Planctomycetaceae bacterium]|nr:HEAT repeat domain-containing protein [Planctomycetaceae bacterium]